MSQVVRAVAGVIATAAFVAGCSSGGSHAAGEKHSSTPAAHHSSPAAKSIRKPTYDGHTSCSSVYVVGESTGIGMVSRLQIPDPSERLEARLHAVGAKQVSVNVSGGRMTIGRLLDRPNAMDVLPEKLTHSFKGCYLIALGLNDAGSAAALNQPGQIRLRIDMIMQRIGNHPVLWPLNRSSSYAPQFYRDPDVLRFDDGLREATKRYPNLRLYDWRDEMDPKWTEADGVHDRRIGSRYRAYMYAQALTVAFPRGLPPNPAAVVGSVWGKPPSPANRPKLPAREGDRNAYWAGDIAATKLYESGPRLY